MNSSEDSEFEQQLRHMELRRPPVEWKALLLPKGTPPWFPKPLVLGLAICWTAIAGFLSTTPENEMPGPPVVLPFGPLPDDDFLLGQNLPGEFIR